MLRQVQQLSCEINKILVKTHTQLNAKKVECLDRDCHLFYKQIFIYALCLQEEEDEKENVITITIIIISLFVNY